MRKLIAAINMTLDGYCDHTAVVADEDLHQHYADLIKEGGIILYGRITYQLMEYWRSVVENPTGDKATDGFALAMDKIPKIVFSRTLKEIDWESATLAKKELKEEVLALREQPGKDILVGSPGLIASLLDLGLIDELQLCVHPVIAGSGLMLFKNIKQKIVLRLIKTKTLSSGAVTLYYDAGNNKSFSSPS